MEWELKALCWNSDGTYAFHDLSDEQKVRAPDYIRALETASGSPVANPIFSKYYVKESVGVTHSFMSYAGNIEYGLCQTLHGEEAAVAAFRASYSRRFLEKNRLVVGIIAGNPGSIATPCGNCRDIMLQDFGEDFEIVSGAEDGGVAVVCKISDYLFNDFEKIDIQRYEKDEKVPELKMFRGIFEVDVEMTVERGEWFANDAYSPSNVYPERCYAACIVMEDKETLLPSGYYYGARDVMCDYHPIYPLRDAIRQARRAKEIKKSVIQSVMIVGKDGIDVAPQVMYKDRQHLLEFNLQTELLNGIEKDPPVYLVAHRNKKVTGVWKTSVKKWLPLPFTPRNFGPEFITYLTNYFQNQGQH